MSEGLFQQQGAPYGAFKGAGQNYQGTVVRIGQVQSRKFVPPNQRAAGKQGELEFWPDGKPKMTAIVTLQTTLRDPSIPGDDGQRSVWIKGKNMTDATKAGLTAAGAQRRGIEVGGWFSMTFTHETPPEFEGGSPAKHYTVEYLLPENNPARGEGDPWADAQAPADFLVNPATTPVQADPAQAAPVQAQGGQSPAAPVQPVQQPAQAAADPLAGFDLDKMTPAAKAALQAMLAQQAGQQ